MKKIFKGESLVPDCDNLTCRKGKHSQQQLETTINLLIFDKFSIFVSPINKYLIEVCQRVMNASKPNENTLTFLKKSQLSKFKEKKTDALLTLRISSINYDWRFFDNMNPTRET